jgi:hypothetical protein
MFVIKSEVLSETDVSFATWGRRWVGSVFYCHEHIFSVKSLAAQLNTPLNRAAPTSIPPSSWLFALSIDKFQSESALPA